jgi:hypothetical protein
LTDGDNAMQFTFCSDNDLSEVAVEANPNCCDRYYVDYSEHHEFLRYSQPVHHPCGWAQGKWHSFPRLKRPLNGFLMIEQHDP